MTDRPIFETGRARVTFPFSGAERFQSQARSAFAELSLSGIVQQIVGNIQEIVRAEMRLAKAEIREEAFSAGRAAGMVGAGGMLALYALGIMLLCLVFVLRTFLPDWIAALIVGALVAAAAGVFVKFGLQRISQVNPAPEQTMDSIREDVQWLKRQTR